MRTIDFDMLDSLPAFEPIRAARALRGLDEMPRKRIRPWRRNRKEEE